MAGNYTLDQILGYVYLTGLIKAVDTGIPKTVPDKFWTTKKTTIGDKGRYTQVKGTRATARLAQYGAPAALRALKNVASVDVKLMHSIEEIRMDPLLLQTLREYTNYDVQQMGIQEVDRQQAEFRAYFDNLQIASLYSMLANGAIWYDGNGNLLPSSTNAVETVTFNMNANNQGHCNGIVTSSWAQNNTDIPGQLRALKLRAAELTGYPLKYAFYGQSIPSYLTQNNYVIDYLSRNTTMSQRFLDAAEIPDGLFGFTWVPVYTSFFEDQNGVNQTIFGTEEVVFTPEIDASWYEMLEGTYMVPSSFNATANMATALASLKQVTGMFSYAVPTHNPPTVSMFMGNTWLPTLKVPDSVFQMVVNPAVGWFMSAIGTAASLAAAAAMGLACFA